MTFAKRLVLSLGRYRLAMLVWLGIVGITLVSPLPGPRSWNDASRLATVESVVDYRTLAIDQSQFIQGRDQIARAAGTSPMEFAGVPTGDRIRINGHFYSHQSVVPALILAGCYEGLQETTGLVAREQPARFCQAMTLASSGLPYLVGCACMFALAGLVGVSGLARLLLVASFGLATLALPYSRQVNSHMMLLGVASLVVLLVAHVGRLSSRERVPWLTMLGIGALGGLGYALDQGAGLLLLLCGLCYCLSCFRRFKVGLVVVLAALPGIAVHHAVTYAYAGTWGPPAAVPEYFCWEGSVFTAENITGRWNHADLGSCINYAKQIAVGERGFLLHNLPLLLALPAALLLWWHNRNRSEIGFAAMWFVSTFGMYALLSTNYAGQCVSIRWFVPLLSAAYLVLAYALRNYPACFGDLLILSAGGAILCYRAWRIGPWEIKVALADEIQIATVGCWAAYRIGRGIRMAFWRGIRNSGAGAGAKSNETPVRVAA